MPSGFSFEDEPDEFGQEFDTEVPEAEALSTDEAAEELVGRLEETQRVTAAVQRASSEVQDRYHTAACYDMLIQQGKFFNEDTKYTAIVEEEIAAFCRKKMEVLMGVRPGTDLEKVPSISKDEIQAQAKAAVKELLEELFSKEGVMALQSLSRVALKKSTIMQAPAPTPAPPKPKPSQAEPQRPVAPTLRRPSLAASQPVAAPTAPAGVRRAPKRRIREEVVQDARTGKNKIVRQDVTPQVGSQGNNPHAKPTPGIQEMAAITEMRAGMEAGMIAKVAGVKLPAVIANAIRKGDSDE